MEQLINQINNTNDFINNRSSSSTIGIVLILFSLLLIGILIAAIKQNLNLSSIQIFASFLIFCFSLLFFTGGIIQIKDDKDYNLSLESKISKVSREEKQVISVQSTNHPYSVVISGTQGTDNVTILTFFNQKQDAINFIKSNASARQVYLSNYLILNASNNKPLKEGTETMLKVSIDKMNIKTTKKALPNVIDQAKEWKDE